MAEAVDPMGFKRFYMGFLQLMGLLIYISGL